METMSDLPVGPVEGQGNRGQRGLSMDVYFIGVGEACDSAHGNTSVRIKTDHGVQVLLDCGFSVPHHYFRVSDDPDELDLVWISHFHGDHYFGMPLLLLGFWEMGRTRPLTVAGQIGVAEKVLTALDMAYSGFAAKLSYEINFLEIEPGPARRFSGLTLQTVQTFHSQRNLGLLLVDDAKKMYYSGDGRPSEDVARLVRGCDLVIHGAFQLRDEVHSHGSIAGCLRLAESADIKRFALVHLDRRCRKDEEQSILEVLERHPAAMLPVEGTTIVL